VIPTILITPAAEDDLVNLWAYIAQDNREAADKVYDAAGQTFATLAAMPPLCGLTAAMGKSKIRPSATG